MELVLTEQGLTGAGRTRSFPLTGTLTAPSATTAGGGWMRNRAPRRPVERAAPQNGGRFDGPRGNGGREFRGGPPADNSGGGFRGNGGGFNAPPAQQTSPQGGGRFEAPRGGPPSGGGGGGGFRGNPGA